MGLVCSVHAIEIRNYIIYLTTWFGVCNWTVLLQKSDKTLDIYLREKFHIQRVKYVF